MPIYPGQNERISWYLPLVGGAEMNRARGLPPPTLFTSRPYPVIEIDGIAPEITEIKDLPSTFWAEAFGVSMGVTAATAIGTIYSEYRGYPVEAVAITTGVTAAEAGGTIYSKYRGYGPEGVSIGLGVTAGYAFVQLIQYRNYEPEGFSVAAGVTAGTAT